ncbi:hypothetical protein D0N50_00515 [Erwinia billingiae]|nr:hypothetical protein D0N50_00515 [Erwinia billingiae]
MVIFSFRLRAAGALAAPPRPGHVVIYAPGDLDACRLPATRMRLEKKFTAFRFCTDVRLSHSMTLRFCGRGRVEKT